jgi:hypothetical protein
MTGTELLNAAIANQGWEVGGLARELNSRRMAPAEWVAEYVALAIAEGDKISMAERRAAEDAATDAFRPIGSGMWAAARG